MNFSALVDEVLSGLFAHDPVFATQIGNHDHDGSWPDLSEAGRQARLAFLAGARGRLESLEEASLAHDQAIDRRILLAALDAARFREETLREDAWNPMAYVYLFGEGIFGLLSRPFAPLDARLRSAASRLRGLPEALEHARGNLAAGHDRPVSRFHTETAVQRMGGVADLARSVVKEAEASDDAALRDEVAAAAEAAIGAVDRHLAWLRDELLPVATGDFRLGPELYAEKFRHALQSDVTPEDLERRAAAAYDEVRAEMARIARAIWGDWMGAAPRPADDEKAVRAVLDAIAADHPDEDDLLDYCRAENARIEDFVTEHDLIGLAPDPLQIVWTPEFLRAFGGAMLIPPGPLDRGLESYFAITPIPPEWSAERRESYLREESARQLRLTTIHEAVPGHYLQLAYANRSPSVVRAVFGSGVFQEGWAVYVTQVMMDVGYGAEDPALMLVHWKFYLRAITNALMDLRIQTGRMDEADAMEMMMVGGFQEEGEAVAKWDRARLSSTQLCEYFLGATEQTALEQEARRRAQAEGREFVYRPYLESVLAHGSPPMPVLREILFG